MNCADDLSILESETLKDITIKKNEKGVTVKGSVTVRICTAADLDEMMALQEIVCLAIENQDIFVATDRKENAGYFDAPNFVIGCFDGEKMIAYSTLVMPGKGPGNYGWDLDWPLEKILSCAKLDTIVVHPDYRGNQLQQKLIALTVELAGENHDIKYLLATVSPYNKYSLHNVQTMGFEILMKKLKYGGKERFILCRTLF